MLEEAVAQAKAGASVWIVAASRDHAEHLWSMVGKMTPDLSSTLRTSTNLRIITPSYRSMDRELFEMMGGGSVFWDHYAAESEVSGIDHEIERLTVQIKRLKQRRARAEALAHKYNQTGE